VDYLHSVLPNGVQADATQIMAWYIDGLSNWTDTDTNRTTTALAELPNSRCGIAICNKLGWSGDPDVSGRGVSQVSGHLDRAALNSKGPANNKQTRMSRS